MAKWFSSAHLDPSPPCALPPCTVAPLAHRLGMWSFHSELADLSFKYLFPTEHAQIEQYVDSKAFTIDSTLKAAKAELAERLGNDRRLAGARDIKITGRTKSIHSIWKKLQRDGMEIDQVNDLVALRIVLDLGPQVSGSEYEDASVCYHVLARVHGCWTPLPRTLKDYISSPKPNGYRSLHTVVLVGTQPVEVQIRTRSMHLVAEYGAAAHWAYTEDKDEEGTGVASTGQAGNAWLQVSGSAFSRSIAKWTAEYECAHDFMQLVREELLGTRVFVFTEKGRSTRILNLARGATVADAAALLDSTAATHVPLIGGEPAQPNTELQNGDVVEFVTMAEQKQRQQQLAPGPLTSWANSTSGAVGIVTPTSGAHSGGSATADDLDADGPPSIGNARVVWRPRPTAAGQPPPQRHSLHSFGGGGAAAAIGGPAAGGASDGDDGMSTMRPKWVVCEKCLPLPGDALTLTTTEHPSGYRSLMGGTLHRANCECLQLRRQLAAGQRCIQPTPALWDRYSSQLDEALRPHTLNVQDGQEVLKTKIVVFTADRPGMLLTVSACVTDNAVNIMCATTKTREVGGESAFQYTVHIRDMQQLETLFAALYALEDVVCVLRGDMEDMLHDSPESFWANAIKKDGY